MQWLLYKEVSKNRDSITGFFLSILRNIKEHLFYKTSPMELEFVFKNVSFVGFHEKVFEWLVANEFLSNSTSLWWPIVANLNLNYDVIWNYTYIMILHWNLKLKSIWNWFLLLLLLYFSFIVLIYRNSAKFDFELCFEF